MSISHCALGVSLKETLPKARFFGAEDIRFTSCCSDSRRCRPGDLFVALLGAEHDGHDFVRQAIDAGAVGVLAERPLPVSIPTCLVGDTRKAYGKICQALVGQPSEAMRVVGITGSHGKTVTSMLLTSILEADGRQTGALSSLGYCDSLAAASPLGESPTPTETAQWLARMQANGCTDAVIELSSETLARHRAAGVKLDAAILTNLRGEHVFEHGSMANYRRAKQRVFGHLKPGGFAVFNGDDRHSQKSIDRFTGPALTVSLHGGADVNATVIERHRSEQTFLITAGSETAPVRTPMIGDCHVSNCLLAAATALALNIDLSTIVRGLESVKTIPGRMERIECGQPFGVFVDGSQSPGSLREALRSLREVTPGRVVCVYGAEGERNSHRRPLLGRVVERMSHWSVISNVSPRAESPRRIAHDLLDGYDRPAGAHFLPGRAAAIHLALEQAQPGDTVLIAGRGESRVQEIDGKRFDLDDRQVARQWLYENAGRFDEAPMEQATATIPFVRHRKIA